MAVALLQVECSREALQVCMHVQARNSSAVHRKLVIDLKSRRAAAVDLVDCFLVRPGNKSRRSIAFTFQLVLPIKLGSIESEASPSFIVSGLVSFVMGFA